VGVPWVAVHHVNKVSQWKIQTACSPLVDLIANPVGINSAMRESLCDESSGNAKSCKQHDEVPGYDSFKNYVL